MGVFVEKGIIRRIQHLPYNLLSCSTEAEHSLKQHHACGKQISRDVVKSARELMSPYYVRYTGVAK